MNGQTAIMTKMIRACELHYTEYRQVGDALVVSIPTVDIGTKEKGWEYIECRNLHDVAMALGY